MTPTPEPRRPGTAARCPALVVVVTGGIGAGKSSFCRLFCRHPGTAHLDADAIVHALLGGDPDIRRRVTERFGAAVCDPMGAIDRAALAAVVFADEPSRVALEGILHPRVRDEIDRRLAVLRRAEGIAIVLVEIPLLVESGRRADGDVVVTVEAPEALRRSRLSRKGMSAEDIARRFAAQTGADARRAAADIVVWNDGDLDRLAEEAHRLWRLWMSGGVARANEHGD